MTQRGRGRNVDVIERVARDPEGVRHTIQVRPRGTTTRWFGFEGLVVWSLGWLVHATVHRFGWDVIVVRHPTTRRRPFTANPAQVLRTQWPSRKAAELEQDRLPDIIEAGRFPDEVWRQA